ncbi:hypothetical protein HKX54_19555 [Sulfitobacter sp. M57]|nr:MULTISPECIES: hypothetical protein [unclassified Sulfitobacter]MDF3416654.1 hypothetical protein [Sulfitobacter sp. KE5]MDF3424145.1 hypothetical protein [Sulfitobacter sp. KE43]MDF3460841.1 hypothetical protein [Sulfitobacter sp. S74]MDF3464735.1 hypothetical protein [Sulfitobacter sp. Ks18]MDF3468656.1 hypothetical protein [Sulfitobacter sp. M05]
MKPSSGGIAAFKRLPFIPAIRTAEQAHVVQRRISAHLFLFNLSIRHYIRPHYYRGCPMSQSRHPDARIKELAEKKAQLDAQIAALDARRRLSEKKDEDRLKWLLGTLVFDRLSAEPALQSIVRRYLPDRLTQRDRDRGLWQILFPDAQEDRS